MPTQEERPPDGDEEGGPLALDILRGLAAEELARSERTGSRARQAFALATGVFAVVQTVAFGSFASTLLSSHERRWVLGIAIAAGFGLAVCAVFLVATDRSFHSKNLETEDVLKMVDGAREGGTPVEDALIQKYATIVDSRRRMNGNRMKWAAWTQGVALVTVAVILAELVYSLHARLS